MKNAITALVIIVTGLVAYFFYSYTPEQITTSENVAAENFTETRDALNHEAAREYKQKNPDSKLDVEAILKQVSDTALISAALRSYRTKNNGTYPDMLSELVPEYTPASMFPNEQIPLDYNNLPYKYTVNADRTSYELCNQDLEKGGLECIKSNK